MLAQELQGEIAESLMGTDGVIDFFPLAQFAVELVQFQRASGVLIELLGVGAIGAFDGPVEFLRSFRGGPTGSSKTSGPDCTRAGKVGCDFSHSVSAKRDAWNAFTVWMTIFIFNLTN